MHIFLLLLFTITDRLNHIHKIPLQRTYTTTFAFINNQTTINEPIHFGYTSRQHCKTLLYPNHNPLIILRCRSHTLRPLHPWQQSDTSHSPASAAPLCLLPQLIEPVYASHHHPHTSLYIICLGKTHRSRCRGRAAGGRGRGHGYPRWASSSRSLLLSLPLFERERQHSPFSIYAAILRAHFTQRHRYI